MVSLISVLSLPGSEKGVLLWKPWNEPDMHVGALVIPEEGIRDALAT